MIRKSHPNDFEMVYRFMCELEETDFDPIEFDTIFKLNLTNPNYFYFSAIEEGKMIGFISCHAQFLLHHCGMVGEIQELFVDRSFRKSGIGRLLISEVSKIAKEKRFKSLEVTSNKKRLENIQVYENCGFTLSHNKFTMNLEKCETI
jgi:(aminoalkyl)phosphonate N-acetyltransferase